MRETAASTRLDIRVELRVKNNVLWHAIHDRCGSVSAFARKHPHIPKTETYNLINFKLSPLTKAGTYRKICEVLAIALEFPIEMLFPDHLYEQIKEPMRVFEACSWSALPGDMRRELLALPAPVEMPESGELERERGARVREVLGTFPPRKRAMIKLYFGIDCSREHTFAEIGKLFKVSTTRAQQIVRSSILDLQYDATDRIERLREVAHE